MKKVTVFTKMLVVAFIALGLSACKCGTNNANATETPENAEAATEATALNALEEHPNVDLGLPSGNLWATCNIGANSPEEAGNYYAWAELEPKEVYDEDSYKFNSPDAYTKYNKTDGKKVLDLEDDVANVKWGGKWSIPTDEDFQELQDNCIWTWNEEKKGYDIKSSTNDNAIFLSAAGYRVNNELKKAGEEGQYWVSDDLHYCWFSADIKTWGVWKHTSDSRCDGRTIRPVYKK